MSYHGSFYIESFEEILVVAESATKTIMHFLIFENLFFYIENMKKKLLKNNPLWVKRR